MNGLALIIGFLIRSHTSQAKAEAISNETRQVFPIQYPDFYNAYPIELSYVPSSVTRSLVDLARLPERKISVNDDTFEKFCNDVASSGHHIQLDHQGKSFHIHLTDQQLTRLTSLQVSQWDRYHLQNVFIGEEPILSIWLQNEEGASLLAKDREVTIVVGKHADGSIDTLTFHYNIKLPEFSSTVQIIITLDVNTRDIVDGQKTSLFCRHLMTTDRGEAREGRCNGIEYTGISQDKSVEFGNKIYLAVAQLFISLQRTRNKGVLYTLMYDKTGHKILAIRRNIKRAGQQFELVSDDYELYGTPVTSNKSANLFLQHGNEGQVPQLQPVQAGNVICSDDGSYTITAMPFGTMERPRNLLNQVYFISGDDKVPLVIPMMCSKNGVNLLSDEVPSYVVTHLNSNGYSEISVVYRIRLPGTTKTEDVYIRFKANDQQVALRGRPGDVMISADRASLCDQDVPLGTELQCILHHAQVSRRGALYTLYLFIYDLKTRYLTAVAYDRASISATHKVSMDDATEVYEQEYKCAKNVNVDIDHSGYINLPQANAGYVSKHRTHDRARGIVFPKGISMQENNYNTQFKLHGIILVTPYLETEKGTSIVDTSFQPNITMGSLDDKDIIRIGYQLRLPENDTIHKITLEFACKTEADRMLNEKINVSLINKYQRFKTDTDTCTIDASVWVEAAEFSREKRTVGIGEKGIYVLMTRLIVHQDDVNKGTIYKFLYDTEYSAFFCNAAPVEKVENVGGKSCRWVKQGEEIHYEYELGGINAIDHKMQNTF